MEVNGRGTMIALGSMCRNAGRPLAVLAIVGGTMLAAAAPASATESTSDPVAIAVIDLDYRDSSGEVRDQRQEHETRLRHFSEALRSDLARSGKYRIVTPECDPAPCSASGSEPAELVARARAAGAKILLFGEIHKVSTLIQWAKIAAVDVETERLALDKYVTFRGDTDEAWDRAEAFVLRDITALPAAR
jgi:hypothetical protein